MSSNIWLNRLLPCALQLFSFAQPRNKKHASKELADKIYPMVIRRLHDIRQNELGLDVASRKPR